MRSFSTPAPTQFPSITAFLTLVGFQIALEKDTRNLFDDTELLLVNHMISEAIAAEPSYITWSLEKSLISMPYSIQQTFFSKGISPAFDTHKLARKLMIENKIEESIQAGVTRVVFIEPGYDIRSWRLAQKHPHVHFIELADGATRIIKINALMQTPKLFNSSSLKVDHQPDYTKFNHNLHLLNYNITKDSIVEKLQILNLCPTEQPTLFIGEDCTPYLSTTLNEKLMNDLFIATQDGHEVLISFRSISTCPLTITDKLLESYNEAVTFSLLARRVCEFVNKKGFRVTGKMLGSELVQWISPTPQAVIPRGDNYYLLERDSTLLNEPIPTPIDINSLPLIVNTDLNEYKPQQHGCTLF